MRKLGLLYVTTPLQIQASLKKIHNRTLVYSALGLLILRILIYLCVAKVHIQLGFFIDLFIFIYLLTWLFFLKATKVYSLRYLMWINFLVAVSSTIIYDVAIILYKPPIYFQALLINKVFVFLTIIGFSIFASICFFIFQSIFRKHIIDDELANDWDIEGPK